MSETVVTQVRFVDRVDLHNATVCTLVVVESHL